MTNKFLTKYFSLVKFVKFEVVSQPLPNLILNLFMMFRKGTRA